MEIYLIRHTKPDIDKGICYGQSDILLADSFGEELKSLHTRLKSSLNIIYTSPLQRCHLLAKELSLSHGNIIINDNLKELNFGKWELQPWSEIKSAELNPWMADYVNTKCPDGESYHQLARRINKVWESILTKAHKTPLGIITHAGPIRALIAQLLEIPPENSFRISIDYGSISKISINNGLINIDWINR